VNVAENYKNKRRAFLHVLSADWKEQSVSQERCYMAMTRNSTKMWLMNQARGSGPRQQSNRSSCTSLRFPDCKRRLRISLGWNRCLNCLTMALSCLGCDPKSKTTGRIWMVIVKCVEGSSAFQVPILVRGTRNSKKPRWPINNRVHIPN
jgi:hypothetical protein